MYKIILTAALLVTAAQAVYAGTLSCMDASGDFKYEKFAQEGGACCGRSTLTLTYKSKALKQVEDINPGPPVSGHKDSNPKLTVIETLSVDMQNPRSDSSRSYSSSALNILIERTDGQSPLPDDSSKLVKVSLICVESHYLFPPP